MHIHRLGRLLALLLVTGLVTAPRAAAEHSPVVISQLYGGGGNSGSTYTHDFVEVFNRSDGAVELDGLSVQYATAAGTTWNVTPLSGSLPPGGYHLVQQAQGSFGTTPLPEPDDTGTAQMSAVSGKVALVAGTQPLACGSSCASSSLDFVGYGAANDFEGTGPVTGLGNTIAALRLGGGCVDTDENAADLVAGEPEPRSSASQLAPCTGGGPGEPGDGEPGDEPGDDPGDEEPSDQEPGDQPGGDQPGEDAGDGACEAGPVSVRLEPAVLWPPNHRLVRIDVGADSVDEVSVRLLDVMSSEPDEGTGSGDLPGDIVAEDDLLLLRAERMGGGGGRTYTATFEVTDTCGGTALTEALVRVPNDRRSQQA